MKKYLVLVLGMLFVFGFTAGAFAMNAEIPSETQATVAKGTTQVTMGGEIRVRGWYLKNFSGDRRSNAVSATPSDSNSQSWYDQRVKLSLGIEASKNTSGMIVIESGTDTVSGTSITASQSDTSTWGNLNSMSSANLKFLEAWILYKGTGLGIPAGLKIGHMPLALGEKQFLDHTRYGDDAIVFFMDPTKQLHIGLLTTKFVEGSVAAQTSGTGNDIDGYVALATYKVGANTFGVNYTYIDDQTGTYTGTKNTYASLQNIGLHANGKAGIVSYKAEFDKQFGDAPDGADPDGSNVNSSDRFKGYGYLLGVGVTPAPIVTIRGEYAYGSGDNVTDDGDNEAFQTTLGNDIHYTQIFEYTTTTPGGARSKGLSNVTYYRAGIDVMPTKDLTASLDYFVLRANKVSETTPTSKNIGTETDLKISYKLDKNLTYFIMAGYLDTGGWWTANTATGTTVQNDKPITQAMHGLTLSF